MILLWFLILSWIFKPISSTMKPTHPAENLRDLIPKSLDDIIRAQRHECRLALATDGELAVLHMDLSDHTSSPVQHTLTDWQILMIHITGKAGGLTSFPKLLGHVQHTGQSWITSNVIGIDPKNCLVRTNNSTYRVTGPRVDESGLDLLHVCATLNAWGVGPRFGVPEFYY